MYNFIAQLLLFNGGLWDEYSDKQKGNMYSGSLPNQVQKQHLHPMLGYFLETHLKLNCIQYSKKNGLLKKCNISTHPEETEVKQQI